MAGLLGDIYSYGNTLKRKVNGLLADPAGTAQQFVGQLGDDTNAQISNMLVGYGMFGNKSVLADPKQVQQARNALADYGAQTGIAGMFVGKGSKTWDAINAKKAEELAAKGVDPRKIWQETGTWKGPDGMWRQEIPDNAASIKNDLLPTIDIRGKSYPDFKVQDALDHQGLFEAYPSVKGIQQSISNDGKFGGTYRDGSDWISLDQRYQVNVPSEAQQRIRDAASNAQTEFYNNPRVKRYDGLLNSIADKHGFGDRMDKAINKFGGEIERQREALGKASANAFESTVVNPSGFRLSPAAKSTQLHELQHAIQQREGFARGGNAESFSNAKKQAESSYSMFLDMYKRNEAEYLARTKGIGAPSDSMSSLGLNTIKDNMDGSYKELKQAQRAINDNFDPEHLYRSLAGEAEARATQARIPLDAAQRRALFPEDSYDVPVNQLIIRGLLGQ